METIVHPALKALWKARALIEIVCNILYPHHVHLRVAICSAPPCIAKLRATYLCVQVVSRGSKLQIGANADMM